MADPINANPTILDISSLPTRHTNAASITKDNSILNDLLSLSLSDNYNRDLKYDSVSESDSDEEEHDELIDSQEIFDLIAHISDPEHPLTLGQLAVVNLHDIKVIDNGDKNVMSEVIIHITPTITHCSLATLIGLGIRVRLERCLPPRFRITILLKEGSHQSENQVNKQLNDKERVAAACENEQLLGVISQMLSSCK